MIIYFQSIRPLYSRGQIQSEPAGYSSHHFLLCLLLSRGLPMLSSIVAKDQVFFFFVFPKASPGHPCLCFPSGACDATCCGIHTDGTMKLWCLQLWTLEKTCLWTPWPLSWLFPEDQVKILFGSYHGLP